MAVPANAVDCHHHIFDKRYPLDTAAAYDPPDASVADYRSVQGILGLARNVIVQPSIYGTDNSCLIDALRQFGTSRARGVAVVDAEVSTSELDDMHRQGIRGIRIVLPFPGLGNEADPGLPILEKFLPLSGRLADRGWHIELLSHGHLIPELAEALRRIPAQIVFAHLGALPRGPERTGFETIAELLAEGRAWMKLSAPYISSIVGAPGFDDVVEIAKTYVRIAPDRVVWGSNWPHPNVVPRPDDAQLLDLLADWVPDQAARTRILVANPAVLYDF